MNYSETTSSIASTSTAAATSAKYATHSGQNIISLKRKSHPIPTTSTSALTPFSSKSHLLTSPSSAASSSASPSYPTAVQSDSIHSNGAQRQHQPQQREGVSLSQQDIETLVQILTLFKLIHVPIIPHSSTTLYQRIVTEAERDSNRIRDLFTLLSNALGERGTSELEQEMMRMVYALLDNLESHHSSNDERPNKKQKTALPPREFYALHRGLTTSDLFTSATDALTAEDTEILAQYQTTELLKIVPTPVSTNRLPPPLTTARLRDINPSIRQSGRLPLVEPKPVTPLYYSPFNSFAPTYDSTGSTTSYTRSIELLESMKRIEEHERSALLEYERVQQMDLAAESQEEQEVNGATSNQAISDALALNSKRIQILLRGQQERLRRVRERDPNRSDKEEEVIDLLVAGAAEGENGTNRYEITEREEIIAKDLIASLSQLLAASSTSTSSPSLSLPLPPRSLTTSLLASLATSNDHIGAFHHPNAQGTLPPVDSKALMESSMTPLPRPHPHSSALHPSGSSSLVGGGVANGAIQATSSASLLLIKEEEGVEVPAQGGNASASASKSKGKKTKRVYDSEDEEEDFEEEVDEDDGDYRG